MFIRALDGIAIIMICIWHLGPKQFPDRGDIGGAVAIAEEPVVADAMLAFREHMDEEPTDKFSRFQRHGGVPTGAFDTVILNTEGDATPVHTDQAAIGDRNALSWFALQTTAGQGVGIARQVCQHCLWTGKRFLGVNNPVDPAQRLEEIIEGSRVDEARMIAKETQLPCIVQPDQPFQNKTPVQTGQNTH